MEKHFEQVADKLKLLKATKEMLYAMIEEVVNHEEWLKLNEYAHHIVDNRAYHSLRVCCIAFNSAVAQNNGNLRSVAIGSILHDFFLYNWVDKDCPSEGKFYRHLCMHPEVSLQNATIYFPHLIDIDRDRITDIILKHMFPFPINRVPSYPESWLVTMADKKETFSLDKFNNPRVKILER